MRWASGSRHEVRSLFRELQEQGVDNFHLDVVYLCVGNASKRTGGKLPLVQEIESSVAGRNSVSIYELHLVGGHTGLVFKNICDKRAFTRIVRDGNSKRGTNTELKRRFELECPRVSSKQARQTSHKRSSQSTFRVWGKSPPSALYVRRTISEADSRQGACVQALTTPGGFHQAPSASEVPMPTKWQGSGSFSRLTPTLVGPLHRDDSSATGFNASQSMNLRRASAAVLEQTQLARTLGSRLKAARDSAPQGQIQSQDPEVTQDTLIQLGFDCRDVRWATSKTKGDMLEALNLLLERNPQEHRAQQVYHAHHLS